MSKYDTIAAQTGLSFGEVFFFTKISESIVEMGYEAWLEGTSNAVILYDSPSMAFMYETFFDKLALVNDDMLEFDRRLYEWRGTSSSFPF